MTTLRDFLTWLESTGLLDPGSDPLSALHDDPEVIQVWVDAYNARLGAPS